MGWFVERLKIGGVRVSMPVRSDRQETCDTEASAGACCRTPDAAQTHDDEAPSGRRVTRAGPRSPQPRTNTPTTRTRCAVRPA
jgi:hypothetical protein